MWGQRDLPLEDEDLQRTSMWAKGSSHTARYTVPLDAGIPPGRYNVRLGIYKLGDMARLDIVDKDEQRHGTEHPIGPISVIAPNVPPAVDELAVQRPSDISLAGKIEVLGYTLSTENPQSGEQVSITVFWRCVDEMALRYNVGLRLVRDEHTAGFSRADPAGPQYPTDRWVPGEILRYTYALPLAADAASGAYQVYVNLYEADGQGTIVPEDVLLAGFEVAHRERLFEMPEIDMPMRVTVAESLEFLGYDIDNSAVDAGGTLRFTLYWRALLPMETSYTVFTHLLDAQEVVRGQRDSVPALGQRPTTGWAAGEIIMDAYEMPVNADAPPGDHQIEIGMYDPATGDRPPMTREDGTPIHERRILFSETISVRG